MFSDLDKFLTENQDVLITGGVEDEKVNEIEKDLGVTLHPSMKMFLKKYGFLMGYGLEVNGCGRNGESQLVADTLRYRNFGLKERFIVVTDEGEFCYCIDNNSGEILVWYRDNTSYRITNKSLEEYILEELKDGKDNV